MQYVYKYLNNRGDVVYVGITNNMARRVKEHKSDKLADIKNPMIYYFPVKHRGDAEMLETYLIGWYGTKKYYNTAKTRKGDFSFLDVVEDFPWQRYEEDGAIEKIPFVISEVIGTREVIIEKEKIVKKKVYVKNETEQLELAMFRVRETGKVLDDLLVDTDNTINMLLRLQASGKDSVDYELVEEGLELFKRRKRIINVQKKLYKYGIVPEIMTPVSHETYQKRKKRHKQSVILAEKLSVRIDEHIEKCKKARGEYVERFSSHLGEGGTDHRRSICL